MEGFTLITVTGKNFHNGLTTSYQCKFGDNLSSFAMTVINTTTLLCRTAKHEPGQAAFRMMSPATKTYVEVSPDVKFEYQQTLFISDYKQHQVKRYYATSGIFVDTFVSPASGGLKGPGAMAFGLDSNFYVASQQTNR